jgi:hypothetical protein
MSLSEVVAHLGYAGTDIASGTVIYAYFMEDGRVLHVNFMRAFDGCLRVSSISLHDIAEEENKILDMTSGNVLITKEQMDLRDRIVSILSEADARLATAECVVLNRPSFHYYWTDDFSHTENGSTVTYNIASAADREKMKYVLLLYTLTTEYADCVYFIDEDYDQSYNRLMFTVYFVSDGYKDAGYDTVKEYYLAIMDGLCEAPDDALRIDFSTADVRPQKDFYTSKNIWPTLLEASSDLTE